MTLITLFRGESFEIPKLGVGGEDPFTLFFTQTSSEPFNMIITTLFFYLIFTLDFFTRGEKNPKKDVVVEGI